MSFYGKVFSVVSEENYEEFVKSIGLPEDRAKALLEYKPNQKIEKNGDEYKITIYTKNGEKVYTCKSGVEFADTFRQLPVKIIFTIDGNKSTQVIQTEIGLTITIKKEYSDDKLVEDISHNNWDGVAHRTYKPL